MPYYDKRWINTISGGVDIGLAIVAERWDKPKCLIHDLTRQTKPSASPTTAPKLNLAPTCSRPSAVNRPLGLDFVRIDSSVIVKIICPTILPSPPSFEISSTFTTPDFFSVAR